MTNLQTEDIRGVEILRTGKWHGTNCPPDGCEFTVNELDLLVQSHNDTSGQHDSPVKLGHDKDQKLLQEDGYPSAGWIKNLHRVGERLVADFVKVPKRIADLMRAGSLAKRSVEISRNFDVAGTKHPLMLTAVALLGADLPAVNGLKDIEKLYQTLKYEPGEGAYYFEASDQDLKEDDPDSPKTKVAALKAQLRAIRSEAESLIKGRKGTPVLRALFRDVEETLDRIAAGRTKFTREDEEMAFPKALLELLGLDPEADEDAIAEAITALKTVKAAGDGGGDGETEATKKLTADLATTRQELLVIQGQQAKSEAESLVDTAVDEGRVFPAQKETLLAMAISDPEKTAAYIKGLPKVVDTSEKGRSGGLEGDALLASVEPTKDQIAVMVSMSGDTPEQRVELMRLNAANNGVELPDGWETKYLPAKSDDKD